MHSKFSDLVNIAKKLRGPGGCPWDQKQTFESMVKYLFEESQEIKEAVEKGDHHNLKEELGDLLFLILMMTEIAEESGEFTLQAVLENIEHKIISRHTWVFGDDKVSSPEEAMELWKRNKLKEKKSS